jgi:uncharacterized protein YlxW (UPF0749 family)
MKNILVKIPVLIICIFLGILIASQGRTVFEFQKQKQEQKKVIDKMVAELELDIKENEKLRESIDSLIKENDRYIEELAVSNNNDILINSLREYKIIAGLADMEGEGIIITLDDAEPRKYVNRQSLIIHDIDIKILLNSLKNGGAKAISVNDERILDISEQVCAGPTILINRNRYSTPYIIKATGNKEMLYDSIIKSERYALMLEDGIRIDISMKDDILIEGYKGKISDLITGLKVINDEK